MDDERQATNRSRVGEPPAEADVVSEALSEDEGSV
jgi:hypothetical protein